MTFQHARRATFSTCEFRTNSSEKVRVHIPASWRGDGTKRAVLTCHAAGGDAGAAGGNSYDGKLLAERLNTIVFVGDLVTGHTWGNDASLTKVSAHWTFAKASYGVKTDKAIIFGGSMGGATAVNWAANNLSSCAAIGLVIPALNVDDIHDNNRGGFAANIETAYTNLAGWNTAEPTNNPYHHFATLASNQIPIVMYPNELDSICLVQYARELRDAYSGSSAMSYNEVAGIDHFPAQDDSLYGRLAQYV